MAWSSFDLGGGETRRAAERQRGEDGDLVAGVVTADIHRRIGLRITQTLRFGEHAIERCAGRLHLAENIITGPV